MFKVKIIGAGSLGNHFSHACRKKGWHVSLCDIDQAALERTKNELFVNRYGKWDESIHLTDPGSIQNEHFDIIIIGTPPDTHVEIALRELHNNPPKVLLIEKPLSAPNDQSIIELTDVVTKTEARVLVGYNNFLEDSTTFTLMIIRKC